MATWTAVNTKLTKTLKQNQGVGVTPGVITYSLDFFSEILKDGLFHHNYTGSINVGSNGGIQANLVNTIKAHLSQWESADELDDNDVLELKDPIGIDPVDPSVVAFNAAYLNFLQLNSLVTVGILASDDPMIVTAITEVKKAYQTKLANVSSVVSSGVSSVATGL